MSHKVTVIVGGYPAGINFKDWSHKINQICRVKWFANTYKPDQPTAELVMLASDAQNFVAQVLDCGLHC
eukprot:UN06960